VGSADSVKTHGSNGFTSHTPVTDGRRIYTVFGSGVVAAHTLDGKRVWARIVERPRQGWGHCASPALGGGRLIVHITDLIALDPETGAEVWRRPSKEKFGSPVVTQIDGKDIVITAVGDVFRASNGDSLAKGIGNLEYATPVVQDGVVYFIEKKARAVKLPKMIDGAFDTLWTAGVKGSRHYASSVVHEGLIYAVSREEKFSILDAKTGKAVFEKDLDLGEGTNSAYPSVTLAGDKLFIGAEKGTMAVIEVGRTYKEIARNTIEGFRSTPVFAGNRMYLRAFDHLYCFEKTQ
jgi:outer membrane protein assembly factor BamB